MARPRGDFTAGSVQARRRMVEVLLAEGMVSDSRVLEAMAKVPRETFVPHFWSLPGPLQTGAPRGRYGVACRPG